MITILLLLLGAGPTAQDGRAVADDRHAEAPCASCHAGGAAAVPRDAAVQRACLACHGRPAGTTRGHERTTSRTCTDCHAFHVPGRVTTGAGAIDLARMREVDPAHCRACHAPRGELATLSAAHRAAARLYHEEAASLQGVTPSEACLRCHARGATSDWRDRTAGRRLAFNEHASHPYGIRVVPGRGDTSNWIAREIDPRIPLFDGRLECASCHLLSAATDDLVVPFPAKYDLCKGCHRHHGDDVAAGANVASLARP